MINSWLCTFKRRSFIYNLLLNKIFFTLLRKLQTVQKIIPEHIGKNNIKCNEPYQELLVVEHKQVNTATDHLIMCLVVSTFKFGWYDTEIN